jgi:hypothetical protein
LNFSFNSTSTEEKTYADSNDGSASKHHYLMAKEEILIKHMLVGNDAALYNESGKHIDSVESQDENIHENQEDEQVSFS